MEGGVVKITRLQAMTPETARGCLETTIWR